MGVTYADFYDNNKYNMQYMGLLLCASVKTAASGDAAQQASPGERQKLKHQQVAL